MHSLSSKVAAWSGVAALAVASFAGCARSSGPGGGSGGGPAYASAHPAAVDGAVAAEERLVAAGQAPEVAGDSYLYVGDLVGDAMLTYDWCFDSLTPERRARWLAYAEQAVWNVWHPELASWGGVAHPWSG